MIILRYLRYCIFRSCLPFSRAIIRLECHFLRYSSWRTGKCVFYGPDEFLATCSKALELLAMLDQPLYESLVAKRITCWLEPKGMVSVDKYFGIAPAFVKWKEQGIIAALVYAQFERESALKGPHSLLSPIKRRAVYNEILSAARSWLEVHRFPRELYDCFIPPTMPATC